MRRGTANMADDGIKTAGPEASAPQANGAGRFQANGAGQDPDALETQEWLDSIDAVVRLSGRERASYLLNQVGQEAELRGVELPVWTSTPYVNTIPAEQQPPFPGNRDLERKIKGLMRWNAIAM